MIFLRKVAEVWNISIPSPYSDLTAALRERVDWLLTEYLPNHNPGDNIPKYVVVVIVLVLFTLCSLLSYYLCFCSATH